MLPTGTHNMPPCARAIFTVTRMGHPVEPADLASSWKMADERREGAQEISAFDVDLTPAEKVDLMRSGIAVIPVPYSVSESEPWPDLKPLPDQCPAVPDLPPELLPEPLRTWLTGVASRMAVPLSGLATTAVVGLASVVGRGALIRPEPGNGWGVVPNLWGCLVAPPGCLKSAIQREALAPLEPLIAQALAKFEVDEKVMRPRRFALNAQLAAAKRSKKTVAEDIRQILEELDDCYVPERRHLVQDTTVERLQEIQVDNLRGLLQQRDELAGWLANLNKPGREGDRAYFLESWEGVGKSVIDRISRGTTRVGSNCVSLFGSIQPARLTELLNGPDDGLIQRFQLAVFVDDLPEWSKPDPPVSTNTRDRVFSIFERLDASLSAGSPRTMRFDFDGQVTFDAWRTVLENRLRSGDLRQDPRRAGFMAKHRSLMPSLAAIFRLVKLAGSPTGLAGLQGSNALLIDGDCARRAVNWCSYLELHVDRLLTPAPTLTPGHALASKIQQGAVRDGMTIRDIAQKRWARLVTSNDVREAAEELGASGWVRLHDSPSGSQGGRPAKQIRLHPEVSGVMGGDSADAHYHFADFTKSDQHIANQHKTTSTHNESTQHERGPSVKMCDLHPPESPPETPETPETPPTGSGQDDLPTVERRDAKVRL